MVNHTRSFTALFQCDFVFLSLEQVKVKVTGQNFAVPVESLTKTHLGCGQFWSDTVVALERHVFLCVR